MIQDQDYLAKKAWYEEKVAESAVRDDDDDEAPYSRMDGSVRDALTVYVNRPIP